MRRAEQLFVHIRDQGAGEIHSMIGAPFVEEPFFDYKRSATSLPSPRLGDENRKNPEKAISGFANSEGVIIWGVDCRHTKGRRSNVHCFDHRPCCVEICRRGIGRIGSVIRRLIQSFGTSANVLPATAICMPTIAVTISCRIVPVLRNAAQPTRHASDLPIAVDLNQRRRSSAMLYRLRHVCFRFSEAERCPPFLAGHSWRQAP